MHAWCSQKECVLMKQEFRTLAEAEEKIDFHLEEKNKKKKNAFSH